MGSHIGFSSDRTLFRTLLCSCAAFCGVSLDFLRRVRFSEFSTCSTEKHFLHVLSRFMKVVRNADYRRQLFTEETLSLQITEFLFSLFIFLQANELALKRLN